MLRNRVLLVDDEEGPRFGVRRFLKSHDFDVEEANDCATARNRFRSFRPDVTILDFRLPDGTALDLIPEFRSIGSSALIVLTAYASIDAAVEAVKLGADQFFTKPVQLDTLLVVIERIIENQRNRQQALAGAAKSDARNRVDPFLGISSAMRDLREKTDAVLRTDSPVLVHGETGTGKTVLARWIHTNSRRSGEAFVDLNCAGISREFLETELFGHEKGAFTGATSTKQGLLEVANRGTVFLDEIGDMDLQVQASLLKVLEEQRFRRLGDVKDRNVDIRLIAATHRSLRALVEERRFRQDLYYRISTLELNVPALRERRDDIPILAQNILGGLARDLGQPPVRISAAAERILCRYDWPGNIRELRNVLERALLRSHGDVIDAEQLVMPAEMAPTASSATTRSGTLEDVERDYIDQVLREENGAIDRVADRLGVSRSAVYYKARKHGIDISKIRN
ncbi:MAG TPA: sigma-54 dependent transcriptional regulator [Thermoanaerobaculia bacterium]|jgi:DNA-binding NtrC family response regulator|nr:sigma-54 dependent transcriptional regulator [Thermoanaerobaculia bacterium]